MLSLQYTVVKDVESFSYLEEATSQKGTIQNWMAIYKQNKLTKRNYQVMG